MKIQKKYCSTCGREKAVRMVTLNKELKTLFGWNNSHILEYYCKNILCIKLAELVEQEREAYKEFRKTKGRGIQKYGKILIELNSKIKKLREDFNAPCGTFPQGTKTSGVAFRTEK